jgi:glycosyltransferase involved in cell wall biosynthesis
MRILLASDSFDPAVGGVQRVVKDLAVTLAARGHAVEVLAPWADGLPLREQIDGLPVHRVRLGRPALTPRAVAGFARRLLPARRSVRRLAERLRPDVVHLHFLHSPLAHLLPLPGVPLVATAHGRDVVGEMIDEDAVGRRAVRRVLRLAAAVTAPSAATLADARSLCPGSAHARFEVVSNALPLDMAVQVDRPPAVDGKGVVAVGELHPKKGFDVLIRAVAALPGVTLRIAGTGRARDGLLALAEELGASDRVELLGFVPREQLPALLRSAAVQVVPSRREPFGLVIVEGFACGVPVIASRVDGIPDVVGSGDAARLVPADDASALAEALHETLADEALRKRMIESGRSRARELSADRTACAYERVYERAVGGGDAVR